MSASRGGLGRGLGALIPTGPPDVSRETENTGTAGEKVPGTGQVVPDFPPLGGSLAPSVVSPSPGHTTNPIPSPPAVPRATSAVPGVSLLNLAIGSIRPNPKQPRQDFEPEALAELVVSLREVGVLQPIVVRTDPNSPGRYELVMGERRWRAAQQAGLSHIPAILRETPDDELLRDALLENLHRSQLNPLEEGAAYQQLLEEFGVTHEELATRIGRSRSQVTNTIRLLSLPPTVQRRVAAGVLSAGHARALLALPDPHAVEVMAARIVAEGLSVRSVEELVALAKGNAAPRAPRVSRKVEMDPRAAELASKVSDHLETRAHVEWGRAKSRLIVEVADADDLSRVVGLILERRDPNPGEYPSGV